MKYEMTKLHGMFMSLALMLATFGTGLLTAQAELITARDSNGDGIISQSEMNQSSASLNAVVDRDINQHLQNSRSILASFNHFDKDSNGEITRDEFLQDSSSRAEALRKQKQFASWDLNQDGEVHVSELREYMQRDGDMVLYQQNNERLNPRRVTRPMQNQRMYTAPFNDPWDNDLVTPRVRLPLRR